MYLQYFHFLKLDRHLSDLSPKITASDNRYMLRQWKLLNHRMTEIIYSFGRISFTDVIFGIDGKYYGWKR